MIPTINRVFVTEAPSDEPRSISEWAALAVDAEHRAAASTCLRRIGLVAFGPRLPSRPVESAGIFQCSQTGRWVDLFTAVCGMADGLLAYQRLVYGETPAARVCEARFLYRARVVTSWDELLVEWAAAGCAPLVFFRPPRLLAADQSGQAVTNGCAASAGQPAHAAPQGHSACP